MSGRGPYGRRFSALSIRTWPHRSTAGRLRCRDRYELCHSVDVRDQGRRMSIVHEPSEPSHERIVIKAVRKVAMRSWSEHR